MDAKPAASYAEVGLGSAALREGTLRLNSVLTGTVEAGVELGRPRLALSGLGVRPADCAKSIEGADVEADNFADGAGDFARLSAAMVAAFPLRASLVAELADSAVSGLLVDTATSTLGAINDRLLPTAFPMGPRDNSAVGFFDEDFTFFLRVDFAWADNSFGRLSLPFGKFAPLPDFGDMVATFFAFFALAGSMVML